MSDRELMFYRIGEWLVVLVCCVLLVAFIMGGAPVNRQSGLFAFIGACALLAVAAALPIVFYTGVVVLTLRVLGVIQ